jgi:protein O-GlcNAc transferase
MSQCKFTDQSAEGTITPILATATLFLQTGNYQAAVQSYTKALELDPDNFDAINALGCISYLMGQYSQAETLLREALSHKPNAAEALNCLGLTLMQLKKHEESINCFHKLLELYPQFPVYYVNAAAALHEVGQFNIAMNCCHAALSLEHDFVPAHVQMGIINIKSDNLHSALESTTRALQLAPNDINILLLLAQLKLFQGRPDEVLPCVSQVLLQQPENGVAIELERLATGSMQDHSTTKEAFFNAGLIDLAEAMARNDLAKVNSVDNHNFLLKCYLASNNYSALDYYHESRTWSQMHAHEELLPYPTDFKNDRNPDRRLRVGIVGDYFVSVIALFTLHPFFKCYDRDKLEIYCYNFGEGKEQIEPIVDHYRDIHQLPGQDFFKLIRNDLIDIMLDINGRIRTPNYFETLLRQPAPIQVNWYNLPCTVGVKAYNYAITDEYSVRDGEEEIFVEKIFKMPTGTITAWSFGGPPALSYPPFERNGYVTFGCFGDFFKVNETVLSTWADLLRRTPHSRLYLKSNNLRLLSERDRVSNFFRQRGVDPERLILEGISPYNQMKKCYGLVDIALDTFPYSGGSTTINALWQGIPVVTVEGSDYRGRSTGSILAGCGLESLIADDIADYIDIATTLAADPAQLIALHADVGMRLAASPQWKTDTFARNFECCLRMIWQDWLRHTQ